MNTFTTTILNALKDGNQFSNENAGWFTINRPSENIRMIYINGEYRVYRNMRSFAIAVVRLINTGN